MAVHPGEEHRPAFTAVLRPLDDVARADQRLPPVLRDEVTAITSEYASELTRHLLLAHQEFPEIMKWGKVPPRFLVLQRINVGLIAILGRLNATANWRRLALELLPTTDWPPATELGRQEATWWESARTRAPAVPAV